MANKPLNTAILDRAIIFAVRAHTGTERRGKGYPYIVHPMEAVEIVATMTADQELVPIMRLMVNDNFLTADQAQMERFLIEHFTYAEGSDPLLQEQVLIASLLRALRAMDSLYSSPCPT